MRRPQIKECVVDVRYVFSCARVSLCSWVRLCTVFRVFSAVVRSCALVRVAWRREVREPPYVVALDGTTRICFRIDVNCFIPPRFLQDLQMDTR